MWYDTMTTVVQEVEIEQKAVKYIISSKESSMTLFQIIKRVLWKRLTGELHDDRLVFTFNSPVHNAYSRKCLFFAS